MPILPPRAAVPNVCPKCHAEYDLDVEVCPVDDTPLEACAPSTDPLIGRLLADRYQIIRAIGEG